MTTYTMNGHRHSTMQVQPEILIGVAGNQVAQAARELLRAPQEKFSCLESPDSRVQLQAALKQIDVLLHRNAQLLKITALLGQALTDAHSLIQKDESIGRSDRAKLRLSPEFHGYVKQMRGEIRTKALE